MIKPYEERLTALTEADPDISSLIKLIEFQERTQDELVKLIRAVRELHAARQANPQLVRLEAEESVVFARLRNLDRAAIARRMMTGHPNRVLDPRGRIVDPFEEDE